MRKTITQCHRSHAYGHEQRFCFSKPICRKSVRRYTTRGSVLQSTKINASQNVTNAIYSQCKAAIAHIAKIERIQQKRFIETNCKDFKKNRTQRPAAITKEISQNKTKGSIWTIKNPVSSRPTFKWTKCKIQALQNPSLFPSQKE